MHEEITGYVQQSLNHLSVSKQLQHKESSKQARERGGKRGEVLISDSHIARLESDTFK